MGHTGNALALPRRSERLAAEQTNFYASNHLLAQLVLTIKAKSAAFAFERDAWKNNKGFVAIKYSDLPPNANVIRSHKIFDQIDCERKKARIVPRGHHDTAKLELRTDFSRQNLEIFHHILTIAAERRWHIA